MNNRILVKLDRQIYELIEKEKHRQVEHLEMIPSENYASKAVLEALGSVFNNKYSEGYPGRRYYGGNENVDVVERIAQSRALKMFGLEPEEWHVNVQPYSGSPANIAVYVALLDFGDKVMGLKLSEGGHLTHGHPVSFSGKAYNFVQYKVDSKTGLLDYDDLEILAVKERPKMIVSGFTAYPRKVDFERIGRICKKVGAYHFSDISHIAGLIVGGIHPSPFPHADVVMTTTHKTLRGPRGAVIFCRQELASRIDRAVFPGLQGGPHDHMTAAKAVCFGEALKSEFKKYAASVVKNAKILAGELTRLGMILVSGGTDTHLILVDVTPLELDGKRAQELLEAVGIIVNKNTIPGDRLPPIVGSGIRLGTPALTSRGMKEKEMKKIAEWIVGVLKNPDDQKLQAKIANQITAFAKRFTVPGI